MTMGTRKGNEEVIIALNGSGLSGSLAKTIQEELMNVGVQVNDDMQEVFDDIGKEAVKKLKETSPENPKGKKRGFYKKGWTYEKGKRTSGHNAAGIVRNKNAPQLTHLLEYGHPIVRKGKVVGNADAIEHIRPVADWCAEEIDKRLIKKLGGK